MPSFQLQRLGENVDAAAWDYYVAAHPMGSIYHTTTWRDIIDEVFGKEAHYLCAVKSDGAICGLLPVVLLPSRILGRHLLSMPYCNYGGILADTAEVGASLAAEAAKLGEELNCDSIELRSYDHQTYAGWSERTDKVMMKLELPSSIEILSKAIGAKVRSQIRRPNRENPAVVHGGSELLGDFYKVFSRNVRDLGTPVYPRKFFETIARQLDDQVHILVIRIAGKPVASCFLIGRKDTIEIPWSASIREYNRVGVNMLLYWEAIRYAIDSGYRIFDFGRSPRDGGTYRFKKQWGAKPHELKWQCRGPSDSAKVSASGDSPKMRLAVKMWQKLPLPIANWLGPKITSNLPW